MKNFLISCIESRIESDGALYGRFLIGPVTRSLAVTLGAGLRRSLLSEVAGYAIITVQILNAQHEYCGIPGIREMPLDIMLNLKKLVFTRLDNTPIPAITDRAKQVYGYIAVRGPGIVTGHDLKLPPGIQCINPDQVIAHLADDGYAHFKCLLASGRSYLFQSEFPYNDPTKKKPSNAEIIRQKNLKRLKQKPPESAISRPGSNTFNIDAVFMPVLRVNYVIHNDEDLEAFPLEIPSRDVTERLIMEIWTNGAVTPKRALHEASLDLIRTFSPFLAKAKPRTYAGVNMRQVLRNPYLVSVADTTHIVTSLVPNNEWLHTDIGILPLSPVLYMRCKERKIARLGDFIGLSYEELLQIPDMNAETLFEILCYLRSYDMQLLPPTQLSELLRLNSREEAGG